jgi:hypothetical protein
METLLYTITEIPRFVCVVRPFTAVEKRFFAGVREGRVAMTVCLFTEVEGSRVGARDLRGYRRETLLGGVASVFVEVAGPFAGDVGGWGHSCVVGGRVVLIVGGLL